MNYYKEMMEKGDINEEEDEYDDPEIRKMTAIDTSMHTMKEKLVKALTRRK